MLFTLETERESSVKGFTELIVNSVRGFCMALADSVPGVSGGTVAFLLGFYDRFIGSLDDLFHGARAARFAAVRFLLKLGAGWGDRVRAVGARADQFLRYAHLRGQLAVHGIHRVRHPHRRARGAGRIA